MKYKIKQKQNKTFTLCDHNQKRHLGFEPVQVLRASSSCTELLQRKEAAKTIVIYTNSIERMNKELCKRLRPMK